jgi:hypothetical protein
MRKMRERRLFILFFIFLRVNADVTELCKMYTVSTKIVSANTLCQAIGGTLWLPQTKEAAAHG